MIHSAMRCCKSFYLAADPVNYRVCDKIETIDWAFNQNGNVSIQFSIAKCHILRLALLVLM